MMEVIIFALGMMIGGALFGAVAYFIGRNQKGIHIKEEEEKPTNKPSIREQWDNLFEYDGTKGER